MIKTDLLALVQGRSFALMTVAVSVDLGQKQNDNKL